ncbi:MAG: sugar-binding protein [bacterium]
MKIKNLLIVLFLFVITASYADNYDVIKVDAEPVLDGKLDDVVWNLANKSCTNFKDDKTGNIAQAQTFVKLIYTNTYLYLGLKCNEPKMNLLISNRTEHDSALYMEDSVELFFDCKKTRDNYMQFVLNTINTHYDEENGNKGVNPLWESAVYKDMENKFWSVEVKIPFSSLVLNNPVVGTKWGANFCRNRVGAEVESSSWAGIVGLYAQPNLFYEITFVGPSSIEEKNWGKIKAIFK